MPDPAKVSGRVHGVIRGHDFSPGGVIVRYSEDAKTVGGLELVEHGTRCGSRTTGISVTWTKPGESNGISPAEAFVSTPNGQPPTRLDGWLRLDGTPFVPAARTHGKLFLRSGDGERADPSITIAGEFDARMCPYLSAPARSNVAVTARGSTSTMTFGYAKLDAIGLALHLSTSQEPLAKGETSVSVWITPGPGGHFFAGSAISLFQEVGVELGSSGEHVFAPPTAVAITLEPFTADEFVHVRGSFHVEPTVDPKTKVRFAVDGPFDLRIEPCTDDDVADSVLPDRVPDGPVAGQLGGQRVTVTAPRSFQGMWDGYTIVALHDEQGEVTSLQFDARPSALGHPQPVLALARGGVGLRGWAQIDRIVPTLRGSLYLVDNPHYSHPREPHESEGELQGAFEAPPPAPHAAKPMR
jgi:hypothetical protein